MPFQSKAVPGRVCFGALLLAVGLLAAGAWRAALRGPHFVKAAEAGASSASDPDSTCARCHAAIFASYAQTSMAQGSGAVDGAWIKKQLSPGSFLHAESGVAYRVFARDGQGWISYERRPDATGAATAARAATFPSASGDPASAVRDAVSKVVVGPESRDNADAARALLRGEQQLRYFIGSGKHGRTYLYQVDGTWFELPINYYTRRQGWGMAPAFDHATTMPANLPTDPNCLHCHATGVAAAAPGTRSRYAVAPFEQGGIGCSGCHGDPSAHLAAAGHGPIVNPGKLDPARRDSACLGCHLEGDAVVYRPGKSLALFQPGQDLASAAIYFVRAGSTGGGGRAASQYEALLRSACKRAAGDRLTCTTCHDPHASPAPAERIAYYRGKCLACHTSATLAANHYPGQLDCAHCHMPVRSSTDISHEQAVDHDIERIPGPAAATPRTGETLQPVGNWKSSDRELGLAYAQMAERGDRLAGERALTLLARAEAAGASDPALHTQLGFLRQMSGDRALARSEYRAALAANPYEPSALANLAVLEATSNDLPEAVALLDRLVSRDPSQTAAGLNLAFIECRLGDTAKARDLLGTLRRYNPDDPAARHFAATGDYAGQHCTLPVAETRRPGV